MPTRGNGKVMMPFWTLGISIFKHFKPVSCKNPHINQRRICANLCQSEKPPKHSFYDACRHSRLSSICNLSIWGGGANWLVQGYGTVGCGAVRGVPPGGGTTDSASVIPTSVDHSGFRHCLRCLVNTTYESGKRWAVTADQQGELSAARPPLEKERQLQGEEHL